MTSLRELAEEVLDLANAAERLSVSQATLDSLRERARELAEHVTVAPLSDGDSVRVRVPDYTGDGPDSDGDYCWEAALVAETTPSGDVMVEFVDSGERSIVARTDVRT